MNNSQTIRMTMAQAVVRYLQAQYSERDGEQRRLIPALFGIFGHGNATGLGQALMECGRDLPFYQPCNEQSMVHTAIGYAKATFRRATLACAASIGPGSTNMITGAATATINRLPVLLFPADYYATRYQGPVLQQLEHPVSADMSVNDCFRPVSRFFDRLTRPEHLLTALPEAMRVLTDPAETGAVTVALPQDVQTHAYDYPARFFDRRVWEIERRQPDPRRIGEAIRLLKAARRPFLVAGGGVHYSEAWDPLQEFAEQCGIPVGETLAGKSAMRRESGLALGGLGVIGNPACGEIASQADLVLCVGTRLSDFTTGSHSLFQHPEVRFIGINVNGHDSHKLGALPVLADAREALRVLRQAAEAAGVRPDAGYVSEVAAVRREWLDQVHSQVYAAAPGEAMSQGQVIGVLNESARAGDTIVAAAGTPPGDLHTLWNASNGRFCHLEFGYSCMGYEIPAALGVRMAQAKAAGEVFVLIGDGTYLMNPTELFTAVREGIKITVVVSENYGHQCIRNLQMNRTGESFGTEFKTRNPETARPDGEYISPDFAENARSFGARTWQAGTPDQLCNALREAREETRPCVIVASVEKHRFVPGSRVWWDVEVAETSSSETTRQLREQFLADRRRLQRYYY